MVQVDRSHYESPSERITNKKTSILLEAFKSHYFMSYFAECFSDSEERAFTCNEWAMKNDKESMVNLVISTFASVTLFVGMVSMVTPIPGGTFLIAVSLTALICSSSRARRCLQVLRIRIEFLNKSILWVEDKVRIRIVSNALRQTRPGADSGVSCDVKRN